MTADRDRILALLAQRRLVSTEALAAFLCEQFPPLIHYADGRDNGECLSPEDRAMVEQLRSQLPGPACVASAILGPMCVVRDFDGRGAGAQG